MDAMDTAPTTVAQAIEAATQAQAAQAAQQQQQQQQQMSQPSPPLQSVSSSGIDNLVCQWQGCGDRLDSAETLYDHVCERHVGRKSTNNLNLTCAWGACRTTTVKRDHITSHIRVHVPLKPHKCDFCGKAFKRPQDLKKHVKTHADDSVLMNSPQPQHSSRSHGGGHSSKPDASSLNIAEAIQAYMANPRGSMMNYGGDSSITSSYPSYQSGMTTGPDSSYGHSTSQYAGYGSVSYPSSTAMADIQSTETRRRAIQALDDFLGDIKRRALNPNNYYDVGQRLQTSALPLPIATGNGYSMGYNQNGAQNGYSTSFSNSSLMDIFNNTGLGGNGPQSSVTQQNYSLPIPNARTKGDLENIDRFLEQLQATVYDSSNASAASGVVQPGTHATFASDYNFGSGHIAGFRPSDSPTTHSSISSAAGIPVSGASLDTPALTPASVSSYSSSGHSPLSSAGRPSLSGHGLYPSLPLATGMSDMASGYPSTTSAPSSGLATGFDELDGRRYSGGRLQRQAPVETSTDVEMADDGAATPKARSEDAAATPKAEPIDPDLREEDKEDKDEKKASDNSGESSTDSDDKRQEEWVENIRVIEALRKWVDTRLKNGEYDDESDDNDKMDVEEEKKSEEKTVETAKLVEEQMAEALTQANAEHDKQAAAAAQDVQYPSLPEA